jgi:hypothetical protein
MLLVENSEELPAYRLTSFVKEIDKGIDNPIGCPIEKSKLKEKR